MTKNGTKGIEIKHLPSVPSFSITDWTIWLTDIWPCSSSSFKTSSAISPCLFFTNRTYFSNRIRDTTLPIMQEYSVMPPAFSFTRKEAIFCIISTARASFTCKKQNTCNTIEITLPDKLQWFGIKSLKTRQLHTTVKPRYLATVCLNLNDGDWREARVAT